MKLEPLAVSGYVLAGGQSSRMGRNKALLELGGKPLIEHAVNKLRRVCDSVAILGAADELERWAPVVRDLHPGCGPMSGLEAALGDSAREWCLVVPVDVPFVPGGMLHAWAEERLRKANARVALFRVDGVAQPALVLIHREMRPFLSAALEEGRYKLFPVLVEAAEAIARARDVPTDSVLRVEEWTDEAGGFANLNTPEEFAAAEGKLGLLDG